MDLCVPMFIAPQVLIILSILTFNPHSSLVLLHSSSFFSTCSLSVLHSARTSELNKKSIRLGRCYMIPRPSHPVPFHHLMWPHSNCDLAVTPTYTGLACVRHHDTCLQVNKHYVQFLLRLLMFLHLASHKMVCFLLEEGIGPEGINGRQVKRHP